MTNDMRPPEVRVNFPSKMETHSPKTDQQLDAIKASFLTLFSVLKENFEILIKETSAIGELPKMITHMEQVRQSQFEMSFLQQFETSIMEHHANILANESKVRALQKFLEEKQQELEDNLTQTRRRYQRLLSLVAKDNESRRQDLDGHAYHLLEKTFPDKIQTRFSFVSLPSFGYLSAHASECAQSRTAGLLEAYKRNQGPVKGYLADLGIGLDQIDSLIHSDLAEGRYRIPVWVVEVENRETGKKQLELLFNSLGKPIHKDLEDIVRECAQDILKKHPYNVLNAEEKKRLSVALRKMGETPEREIERFLNDEVAWHGPAHKEKPHD